MLPAGRDSRDPRQTPYADRDVSVVSVAKPELTVAAAATGIHAPMCVQKQGMLVSCRCCNDAWHWGNHRTITRPPPLARLGLRHFIPSRSHPINLALAGLPVRRTPCPRPAAPGLAGSQCLQLQRERAATGGRVRALGVLRLDPAIKWRQPGIPWPCQYMWYSMRQNTALRMHTLCGMYSMHVENARKHAT